MIVWPIHFVKIGKASAELNATRKAGKPALKVKQKGEPFCHTIKVQKESFPFQGSYLQNGGFERSILDSQHVARGACQVFLRKNLMYPELC